MRATDSSSPLTRELTEYRRRRRRFNLFETLGIFGLEATHEKMLAWLLDPNENHGYGGAFLRGFAKLAGAGSVGPARSVKVSTQHPVPGGRLDVVVSSDRAAIVIELKTFAEATNDFQAYRDWARKSLGPDTPCVYLTPSGASCPDHEWKTIRYGDVGDLIRKVLATRPYKGSTADLLVHYTEWLQRYFLEAQAHTPSQGASIVPVARS